MNAAKVKKSYRRGKAACSCRKLGGGSPITSSMGIISPVMPTGRASVIHIVVAHTRTASVDFPAGDMPSGSGMTHTI